jgi:hypothetical protein
MTNPLANGWATRSPSSFFRACFRLESEPTLFFSLSTNKSSQKYTRYTPPLAQPLAQPLCRLALQCGHSRERSRCLLLRIRFGPRAAAVLALVAPPPVLADAAAAAAPLARATHPPVLAEAAAAAVLATVAPPPVLLAEAAAAAVLAEPAFPPVLAPAVLCRLLCRRRSLLRSVLRCAAAFALAFAAAFAAAAASLSPPSDAFATSSCTASNNACVAASGSRTPHPPPCRNPCFLLHRLHRLSAGFSPDLYYIPLPERLRN